MSPGRTVLSASSPARPRPVAPPCAPTRPARGVRVLDSTNRFYQTAFGLLTMIRHPAKCFAEFQTWAQHRPFNLDPKPR